MDRDDLYRLLVGIISSGYIANTEIRKFYDDHSILREAKDWAAVIMSLNSEHMENRANGHEFTGFVDRDGHRIYDGDIFVDLKQSDLKYVPKDLIENYTEKYSSRISLHPVFWDEELGAWCSNVFNDADLLSRYLSNEIVVVTNNVEHPELYNH